jgi:hypothetical protein
MWTLHKDCKEFIKDSWNVRINGCPMYTLNAKLKILKNKLKKWNIEVYGNVHAYVDDAEKKLANIQNQINLTGHTDALMNDEKNAQMSLDEALNRQEVFWKEKARIRWHMDGDRNSKYFHRVTKIKNKTKMISSIRNEEEIITNPQRIADHFVDYFSNLFGTNTVLQDHSLADEVIPKLIDEQTNNLLTSIPNKEEIKRAVFDLNLELVFFKLTRTLFNMMSLQQLFNFFKQDGCFKIIMQTLSF